MSWLFAIRKPSEAFVPEFEILKEHYAPWLAVLPRFHPFNATTGKNAGDRLCYIANNQPSSDPQPSQRGL